MPETINIESTAQTEVRLHAAIESGELVLRYASDPLPTQKSLTIHCDDNLSARILLDHCTDDDGSTWLVSASPGTRTTGAPWQPTAGGIVDQGPDPDTTGTNDAYVPVTVFADPPSGSTAARKKKLIHIKIEPQTPQPEDVDFG